MKEQFYPPRFREKSFHCPFCGVYAKQNWLRAYEDDPSGVSLIGNLFFARCTHCDARSIWLDQQMIVPTSGGVDLPNSDLPLEIVADYNEARDILNKSPRGA